MTGTTTTVSHTATTTTSSATASCTTAVPGRYGYVPEDACNANWQYNPSFTAAIAFSVLFGLVSLGHVIQAFTFKKGFSWVIIMGAVWETGSFVVRSLGAHNQQSQAEATVSQLLLLLAPLWVNAYVYMVAGRLIYCFIPEKKVYGVKGMSIGKYFVWLDIFSFLVQAVGGFMTTPGNSAKTVQNGLNIYMGGIGLQQFFIVLFTILIFGFHRKVIEVERSGAGKENKRWKWMVWVLYAALALITIRIIYRLIEFSRGFKPSNPLPFHEIYVYVLDAAVMFIAILLFNLIHPGLVLFGPDSTFPSRKERRAAAREEKAAKKAAKDEMKRAKKGGYTGVYENSTSSGEFQQSYPIPQPPTSQNRYYGA